MGRRLGGGIYRGGEDGDWGQCLDQGEMGGGQQEGEMGGVPKALGGLLQEGGKM